MALRVRGGNNMLGSADYADLSLDAAIKLTDPDTPGLAILHQLQQRRARIMVEMTRFRELCYRWDALYYANDVTRWGADLWADDPSAKLQGRSHISVNTPAVYVDIPAALQSVLPTENMLATTPDDQGRMAAANLERLYYAWKKAEKWEREVHQANIVKGLYGRTAGLVTWDDDLGRPTVKIIDQPKNLYLGWKSTDYSQLDWAAYVTRMSPGAIAEEFGVDIINKQLDGQIVPYVRPFEPSMASMPDRPWLTFGPAMIEVWDYWYRTMRETPVQGKPTKMVVHRALFVGNLMVSDEEFPELGNSLPIIPLFNTYIPGDSNGRSDLYDVEQLIHEKMQRLTNMAQMISSGAAGNYFQLTGADAPRRVPPDLQPTINRVVAPGPGNRIEVISPSIQQFQAEQYLSRIDREMAMVSGLGDVLLGLASPTSLGSSRAVSTLIANFETRIAMRRALLYEWRVDIWNLVTKVWAAHEPTVKAILDAGGGLLELRDPSLVPRDDTETAQKAISLVNAKLWSAKRGMDATDVDDPETEQDIIREERTDASLYPADVQVEVQLLSALKAQGIQAPSDVQQEAGAQLAQGQSDMRNALGQALPGGSPALNQPQDQAQTPPEGGPPSPGGGPPEAPFASAPQGAQAATNEIAQNMIQGGKMRSRLTQNIPIPTRRG